MRITRPMLEHAYHNGSVKSLMKDNCLLLQAARHNDVDGVRLLMDFGCDVNQHDKWGATAITVASARANIDIVRELLIHYPTPIVTHRYECDLQLWPGFNENDAFDENGVYAPIVSMLAAYPLQFNTIIPLQRRYRANVMGSKVRAIMQKSKANAIALIAGSTQNAGAGVGAWQNTAHYALCGDLQDKIFPKQWGLIV